MARDMGLCQPCLRDGRPTPAVAVDHIKPKASGGTDETSNLECICGPCHDAKTAKESAIAQGRTPKQRISFTPDGLPIW